MPFDERQSDNEEIIEMHTCCWLSAEKKKKFPVNVDVDDLGFVGK